MVMVYVMSCMCADFHVGKVYVKDDIMQEMNKLNETQEIPTPMFELDDDVKIYIKIPKEVLRKHWHLNRFVRMASLLFRNMSRLLPNSLDDGVQNDTLVKINKSCPSSFHATLIQLCTWKLA